MPKGSLPDLVLAGFGSAEALQLTLEAQQYAVRAGRVLSLRLPARLAELLKRQGVEVRALDGLFDDDPAGSYARAGEAVLATAKQDPPAIFLSQGSPLFLNSVTRYLVVEARKRGLTVMTLPGVSPVDAVVADLGVDVGTAGLQVLAARALVARPGAINPRMPLLLLEAGAAGPGENGNGFAALVESLRLSYPDSQPMTVLKPAGSGMTRVTKTLGRIQELAAHIDGPASLFIDVARGEPAGRKEVSM